MLSPEAIAALDAAFADNVQFVAHRINDFGELIKVAAGTIKLTATMVRHHDAGATDVDGTAGVGHAHDAFQGEMTAPTSPDIFSILPAH